MSRINPKDDRDKPFVQVSVPDGVGGSKVSQVALNGNSIPVAVESGAWWMDAIAIPARPVSILTDFAVWLSIPNVVFRLLVEAPMLWSGLGFVMVGGLLLALFSLALQRQFSEPHVFYRVAVLAIATLISFL